MATQAATPEARAARSEHRWAARGRSPHARLLVWLARAWPWAWRVRLDLIVLFNLALGVLCVAFAHILAPAIVVRTHGYSPELAATVLFVVEALAALGFSVWWGFCVTRSGRLRQAARYSDQPGLLLTILVFLSFAFWVFVASANPLVNMLREPITGRSIEAVIQERMEEAQPTPAFFVEQFGSFSGLAPGTRPSVAACADNVHSGRDVERNGFMCALAGKARKASILSLLTDISLFHWRTDASSSDAILGAFHEKGEYRVPVVVSQSLGREVRDYAFETEPWKSRIAEMRAWERPWEVLDDPALPPAFARSTRFERFVAHDMMFGNSPWALPEQLFERAPHITPADVRADADKRWLWRVSATRELMATPTFMNALEATEQSIRGDPEAAPPLSRERWSDLRIAWGDATIDAHGYRQWKEALLRALVLEGAFDREVRAMAPYEPSAAFWQDKLDEPVRGPEAALARSLTLAEPVFLFMLYAVSALALFLVLVNQAGLGSTLAALAANACFAIVMYMLFNVISQSTPDYDKSIGGLILGTSALAILAPLGMIVLAMQRRARSRGTTFFAASSIWAAAIWLPTAIAFGANYLIYEGHAPLPWLHHFPWALSPLVIGFALLVQSMLTRASRLPLAQ